MNGHLVTGRHLHGRILAEFSRTQETEPSLRVKSATLWLYIHFKTTSKAALGRLSADKRPTIYVFRVQHHPTPNDTASDNVFLQHFKNQK